MKLFLTRVWFGFMALVLAVSLSACAAGGVADSGSDSGTRPGESSECG